MKGPDDLKSNPVCPVSITIESTLEEWVEQLFAALSSEKSHSCSSRVARD